MSLFERKTLSKTEFFARENQVGGSQLRSRSWSMARTPFALKYRGNATGKEAFNSEGLLDQNLKPAPMPAGETLVRSASAELDSVSDVLFSQIREGLLAE